MEELIQILVQFGGGKGGEPNNVVIRFLLPTFFWCILASISLSEYRKTKNRKDLSVGIAALIGMSREQLMFVAEYGGLRGFVDFRFLYPYYPPLEHAFTMLSCSVIGYAFLNLHLQWKNFPLRFLKASIGIIVLLYAIIATSWPLYLERFPGISFGMFWGDLAFRAAAVIMLGVVIGAFVHALGKGEKISASLICGFTFFFLDEFLMIFNILSQERHVEIFAPIRHNLHIWAVPFLVGMYWNDRYQRLITVQQSLTEMNNELENRVNERTRKLTELNREMETFNYSVSHDLRAPVRHIDGYASILLADSAELPDNTRECLIRIKRANTRMNEMIEALLTLSRTSMNELQPREIDLSRLARDVASEISATDPARRVTFEIAGCLTATGDIRLMRLVMENLLGNAWKYTSGREKAKIVFGGKWQENESVFFVRDNGTGFDLAHASKLFAPFQRLHNEGDFPGIGIGLATVQQIIRRHGGRVWAEGRTGEGATFYFALHRNGNIVNISEPEDIPIVQTGV